MCPETVVSSQIVSEDRFGENWRGRSLQNLLKGRIELEKNRPDASKSELLQQGLREDIRLINWAIFSCYMEIIRRGSQNEIGEANKSLALNRTKLSQPTDSSVPSTPELQRKRLGEIDRDLNVLGIK